MLFQAPPNVADSFHISIGWFYVAGRGAYGKQEELGNPSLSIISVANTAQKWLICLMRDSQHIPPCVLLVTRILTRPYWLGPSTSLQHLQAESKLSASAQGEQTVCSRHSACSRWFICCWGLDQTVLSLLFPVLFSVVACQFSSTKETFFNRAGSLTSYI